MKPRVSIRVPLCTLAGLLLIGCANPGVVQVSPGVYMIAREDHAGIFGSSSRLRAHVIRDANAFAAARGKVAIPLMEKAHPVGVFADWASFEYRFRLVDKSSPEAVADGSIKLNQSEHVIEGTGTSLRPDRYVETEHRPSGTNPAPADK